MARMVARCILVFFAPLALLPGCQCFPSFARPAPVEIWKSDAPADAKLHQLPDLPVVEAKSSVATRVEPAPKPPAPVFDRAYLNTSEPKKRPGPPGVVLFEPKDIHLTKGQTPAAPVPAASPNEAPAAKALQCLIDGKHAEALQLLQAYDKTTQEFLISILPVVSLVTQTPIDKMRAPDIVTLNEVFTRWSQAFRNRTELGVSKMCFCRQVNGFGAYEPLPANHVFLAGTPNRYGEQVQLYVELKNFVSEPDKTGDFVTKLACSLELKNAHGEKVWSHAFQREQTTYRRHSRLNDLHANFSFPVPAIPPGTYHLTIQIIDETLPNHRRVKQESLVFRVTPVATPAP